MLTGGEELRKICVLRDGSVLVDEKCDDAESVVWRHIFSVPDWCKGLFGFSTDSIIHVIFPVYYSGGLRRFCLAVDRDFVESFSPDKLRELILDIIDGLKGKKSVSVVNTLVALFKTLIGYYHEELSKLDTNVEELIHRVMKGHLIYEPIYKLYSHASRLHRGVHGLIYALQRLDGIYGVLKDLTDEAIMLENMYSTSIDRITQAFNLYYTLISEKTNRVVTKINHYIRHIPTTLVDRWDIWDELQIHAQTTTPTSIPSNTTSNDHNSTRRTHPLQKEKWI